MDKSYRSHIIPKQNSKGVRIIHEFDNVDKHRDALEIARRHYIDFPLLSRDNRKISLRNSVHGYPYGNANMIDLMRRFLINSRSEEMPQSSLCSFDLSNFYHYVTKDMVSSSKFSELTSILDQAFVEVGNGIEVLAQGSPLSQDISNMCLLEIDLKSLAIMKTFNTWTRRSKMHSSGRYSKFSLPVDYDLGERYDIPVMYKEPTDYVAQLTDGKGAVEIASIYAEKSMNTLFKASYMRYVDNIYISVSANKEVSSELLTSITESLTKKVKSVFLSGGFSINNLKNHTSNSNSNRRMPILGLNVSDRVKCNRYYLNKLRAGLFNFTKGAWSDVPQSLASSVIFSMYVDPKSHNRLRKCTEIIRGMDLTNAPNAKSMLNFIDRENKITNEIPSNY